MMIQDRREIILIKDKTMTEGKIERYVRIIKQFPKKREREKETDFAEMMREKLAVSRGKKEERKKKRTTRMSRRGIELQNGIAYRVFHRRRRSL